jgi:hypothetical protein
MQGLGGAQRTQRRHEHKGNRKIYLCRNIAAYNLTQPHLSHTVFSVVLCVLRDPKLHARKDCAEHKEHKGDTNTKEIEKFIYVEILPLIISLNRT